MMNRTINLVGDVVRSFAEGVSRVDGGSSTVGVSWVDGWGGRSRHNYLETTAASLLLPKKAASSPMQPLQELPLPNMGELLRPVGTRACVATTAADPNREDNPPATCPPTGAGAAVRHVVVVCTGSGIAGAVSAVEAIFEGAKVGGGGSATSEVPRVHLYCSVRDVASTRCLDRLERLMALMEGGGGCVGLDLKVVPSSSSSRGGGEYGAGRPSPAGRSGAIMEAVRKGEEAKRRIQESGAALVEEGSSSAIEGTSKKVLAQDVFGYDLLLSNSGFDIDNSLIVVCGRRRMVDGVRRYLFIAAGAAQQQQNPDRTLPGRQVVVREGDEGDCEDNATINATVAAASVAGGGTSTSAGNAPRPHATVSIRTAIAA